MYIGNFWRAADDQEGMASQLLGRRRHGAVVAGVVTGVLLSSPAVANAHVEATAEGAQAGAGPVTVDFVAEAESTTVGIVGVKTQLPEGVLPEWVSLAAGPTDWALTPTADGYEIGGPDIGPGVDLTFTITIAQLPPDITELPLKTLLYYADGREDAWIELPTESNPQPENPAPVVAVAPAPPGATTAPATSSAAPSTTTAAPTSAAVDQPAAEDAGEEAGWWSGSLSVAVLGGALVAGGLWFWRSRTRRRPVD